MKNKIFLAIAVFALLAVVGGGIMSASAATNSTSGKSGFHPFWGKNKTMTAEQKAAWDEKMKTAQEAQTAKQAAIDAAIAAGNYDAWVKAVGENCPLLKKITANNFSQYVQAENLMKQARAIYQQLGVNKEGGCGLGKGGIPPTGDFGAPRGHGFGRGFATSTER